jgi:tRNA threonylcarbamoyladenosine biosynthesis protein TsaB
MTVLAIDTSTDILSVAVQTDTGGADSSLDLGLRHAESLMGLVDACLAGAGLPRGELGLVACASGPGSFTGLRIGMAAAKGIADGLGIPWIGVPTLDALAWGYDFFPGAVAPIVDGKKGRVYSAIYFQGERRGEWLDLPLAKLAELLDTYPRALVTGPDAELFESFAAERPGFAVDARARTPAARAVAVLGRLSFLEGGPGRMDEGPLYLRPSEAEEARTARADEADAKLAEEARTARADEPRIMGAEAGSGRDETTVTG